MWAPRGSPGSHPVGPGPGQHEAGAGFGSGSRGAGRDAGRAKRGESRGTGKARPGSPERLHRLPSLLPLPLPARRWGRWTWPGSRWHNRYRGPRSAVSRHRDGRGRGRRGRRGGRSRGARARPPLAPLTPLPILGHPWPAVARLFGPGRTRGRSAAPVSPRLFSGLREGTVAAHIWAALGAAREQPPKGNAEGSAYRAGLGGRFMPC